ncbi:MAG: hypothetical protein IPK82_11495 [Polyangiaceae bacterium]|nr:hypothetical protein [Polyangiaceae bacterium]
MNHAARDKTAHCRRISVHNAQNVAALFVSAVCTFGLVSEAFAQVPPPGTPGVPGPAPTAPTYPTDMQAGGLAPPSGPTAAPTQPVQPPPTQTVKDLEDAKKKDSKRGLTWFWLNAEGGFSHVDMRTFQGNEDFTFGFVPTQATGGMAGVGLGARLVFITLGARGRVGFFNPWQMFTVGGEIGFHIPLGRIEPHFELGGGYAALGSVQGLVQGATNAISISGGYGRVSGGLDIFLAPWFSVGILASGDFLALIRPGLSLDQISAIKADPSLSDAQRLAADGLGLEGSSYGTAIGVSGVLGLHF